MDNALFQLVLRPYGMLDDGQGPQPAETLKIQTLAGGLINDTFALGQNFVLQRLHPIFRAEVNDDIAALVPELLAAHVPVPKLVRTADGQTGVRLEQGNWRILTRLPGKTLHRLENVRQAEAAGRMIAQFHAALKDSRHTFHFTRPGAHDTHGHFQKLADALTQHPEHRLHEQVQEMAMELTDLWQEWGKIPQLPERIIHGDLKVSNLLFDGDRVVGVLDLDTMARSSLDVELGDALRSWVNATTEDEANPRVQTELFHAAMHGYLEVANPWLTLEEQQAIVPAIERICLELAARFAADALNEAYFGWNSQQFPARGEHNLTRARNQLGLARDVRAKRAELQGSLLSRKIP